MSLFPECSAATTPRGAPRSGVRLPTREKGPQDTPPPHHRHRAGQERRCRLPACPSHPARPNNNATRLHRVRRALPCRKRRKALAAPRRPPSPRQYPRERGKRGVEPHDIPLTPRRCAGPLSPSGRFACAATGPRPRWPGRSSRTVRTFFLPHRESSAPSRHNPCL